MKMFFIQCKQYCTVNPLQAYYSLLGQTKDKPLFCNLGIRRFNRWNVYRKCMWRFWWKFFKGFYLTFFFIKTSNSRLCDPGLMFICIRCNCNDSFSHNFCTAKHLLSVSCANVLVVLLSPGVSAKSRVHVWFHHCRKTNGS